MPLATWFLLSTTDGQRIELDRPILLLGREAECDIRLESKKVSRKHCCLLQTQNRWLVRDLGSLNGIRINRERTILGELHVGDELQIGQFVFRVCEAVRTTDRAAATD